MANDAERYVTFFKASLVFFGSLAELRALWAEQADNRRLVGVRQDQVNDMAEACTQRIKQIERQVQENTEVIPIRPHKR